MSARLYLIAIDFASPWLLFGLAGASIPVIIHLLHRRKAREIPWAAMKFLADAARKQSRRMRWEQWLLLCVRCLALACVALALSRPFFENDTRAQSTHEPRHLILVIDDSFSMGYRQGEETRLEEALDVARRLIETARVGDGLSLITTTAGNEEATIYAPTYNKESALAELKSIALTELANDPQAIPSRLKNLLREAPELKRKELVLIGDFSARDWPLDDPAQRDSLRSEWTEVLKAAEVSLINLGAGEAPNAGVVSVRVEGEPALAGRTVFVRATLRAWGGESLTGKLVEFFADGKQLASRRLDDVDPHQATIDFEYLCSTPGEHKLEVRLQPDRLAIDDVRAATLKVSQALRVLIVDGRFASPPRARSSYYLSRALSARSEERAAELEVVTTLADPLELVDLQLSNFDLVALCNLPALSETVARRLSAFLHRGGSLLVVGGDLVRPDEWNARFDAGWPLKIPFRFTGQASPTPEQMTVVGFLAEQLDHPIVAPFRGNPGMGLESALIWNYLRIDAPRHEGSQVVLRFENGDPALVEVNDPAVAGRCLFVLTSMDATWGSWAPLSASFPPIAWESVLSLLRPSGRETPHIVGKPLSGRLPPDAAAGALRLRTPQGLDVELEPLRDDLLPRWQYDEVRHSGIYELTIGATGRSQLFSVGLDPTESDLTSVSETELRQQFFGERRVAYRDLTSGTPTDLAADFAQDRSPLVAALLWTALVLLAVETLLAWSFPVGLFALVAAAVFGVSCLLMGTYGFEIGVSGGLLLGALLLLYAVRRGLGAAGFSHPTSAFRRTR